MLNFNTLIPKRGILFISLSLILLCMFFQLILHFSIFLSLFFSYTISSFTFSILRYNADQTISLHDLILGIEKSVIFNYSCFKKVLNFIITYRTNLSTFILLFYVVPAILNALPMYLDPASIANWSSASQFLATIFLSIFLVLFTYHTYDILKYKISRTDLDSLLRDLSDSGVVLPFKHSGGKNALDFDSLLDLLYSQPTNVFRDAYSTILFHYPYLARINVSPTPTDTLHTKMEIILAEYYAASNQK